MRGFHYQVDSQVHITYRSNRKKGLFKQSTRTSIRICVYIKRTIKREMFTFVWLRWLWPLPFPTFPWFAPSSTANPPFPVLWPPAPVPAWTATMSARRSPSPIRPTSVVFAPTPLLWQACKDKPEWSFQEVELNFLSSDAFLLLENFFDVDLKWRHVWVFLTLRLQHQLLRHTVQQQPILRLSAVIDCRFNGTTINSM
jgi:hypothetical protein